MSVVRGALLALCLLAPLPVAAEAPPEDCLSSVAAVAAAPRFEEFPAPLQKRLRAVPPRLTTRDAQEFRTALGEAAARGPNFAGHYTVAVWGCGAACNDFAIIDAVSGRVFFDAHLRPISGMYVAPEPDETTPEFSTLRFRPDSRLLIVLGAPGEDEARDGVAFFEWTGTALRELRFVPRAQACAPRG